MSAKNLEYYLNHLEEMPTDPAELERLAQEQLVATGALEESEMTIDRFVETDDKPADKADAAPSSGDKASESEAPAAETPKDESPKEEAKPEEKPADVKPDGVLAKDGKNVIPYAVLENARDRAATAERLIAEKDAEIARLTAAKPNADVQKTEELSEEELTALETESPTLARVLRGQQSELKELRGTISHIKGRVEQREATEAAEVKSEVQQAIDAVPELAAMQAAEDQTAWNIAAAHDRTLRALPKYQSASFEERFKKVLELTKQTLADEQSAPAAPKSEPAKPAPTAEEIRAAAEAKLRAAQSKATPKSLSDIPGGAPPAVDERGRVEQMSAFELGSTLLNMTAEQQEAYLATL